MLSNKHRDITLFMVSTMEGLEDLEKDLTLSFISIEKNLLLTFFLVKKIFAVDSMLYNF